MDDYRPRDYERWRLGAMQSAKVMVPLVLQITPAHSVIDVGCGQGAWAAEFLRNGVLDVIGIDGHVDPAMLLLPEECFVWCDLTQPFAHRVGRRFDLVLSLEVAEHLPPATAELFVDGLTALGDAVVFSAAIPGQGGRHHLNEQWPSYWAGLFARRGLRAVDAFRRVLWTDTRVETWYRQNTILYTRAAVPESGHAVDAEMPLDLVHPRQFERIHQQLLAAREPRTLRRVVSELPHAIERAIRCRLLHGGGRR